MTYPCGTECVLCTTHAQYRILCKKVKIFYRLNQGSNLKSSDVVSDVLPLHHWAAYSDKYFYFVFLRNRLQLAHKASISPAPIQTTLFRSASFFSAALFFSLCCLFISFLLRVRIYSLSVRIWVSLSFKTALICFISAWQPNQASPSSLLDDIFKAWAF